MVTTRTIILECTQDDFDVIQNAVGRRQAFTRVLPKTESVGGNLIGQNVAKICNEWNGLIQMSVDSREKIEDSRSATVDAMKRHAESLVTIAINQALRAQVLLVGWMTAVVLILATMGYALVFAS